MNPWGLFPDQVTQQGQSRQSGPWFAQRLIELLQQGLVGRTRERNAVILPDGHMCVCVQPRGGGDGSADLVMRLPDGGQQEHGLGGQRLQVMLHQRGEDGTASV